MISNVLDIKPDITVGPLFSFLYSMHQYVWSGNSRDTENGTRTDTGDSEVEVKKIEDDMIKAQRWGWKYKDILAMKSSSLSIEGLMANSGSSIWLWDQSFQLNLNSCF